MYDAHNETAAERQINGLHICWGVTVRSGAVHDGHDRERKHRNIYCFHRHAVCPVPTGLDPYVRYVPAHDMMIIYMIL